MSVLRRYTPPTCTLEIAAKASPLSRWAKRPVLKQVRFRLRLDDPKLPEDQQVVIQGNQEQLETLSTAVETYVQRLLSGSAKELALVGAAEPQQTVLQSPSVHLHPRGLLSHDLHLGSLATGETPAIVTLTASQLFDLANALDNYAADLLALPSLDRSAWYKPSSAWAKTAAVLLLAGGTTAAIAQFVLDVSSPTLQSSAPETQEIETGVAQGLDPGNPTPRTPGASPSPSPSLDLEPLPPPPPVGSVTPQRPLPPVNVPQSPVVRADVPAAPQSEPPPARVAPIPAPSQPPSIASAPVEIPAPDQSAASAPADAPTTLSIPEGEAPQTAARSGSAFDSIPQVAEVRDYFQQRWQPPEELNETLEYRLLLNPDGTIQRVVPLGRASENFIDRTDIPLRGEPFVSPIANGSSPQIRLVLDPDGRVQAFLEYAN